MAIKKLNGEPLYCAVLYACVGLCAGVCSDEMIITWFEILLIEILLIVLS